jgi:soluble lytic murein transglycosylase-like protein
MSAERASPGRRHALQRLARYTTAGWVAGGAVVSTAAGQIEEPLSHAVRTALSAAVVAAAPPEPVLASAVERQAYAQWLSTSSAQLARWLPQTLERQEFLQTLWYEARRAGLSLSLVLALVQTESAFRKYAVSSAGARGYMQVMPFWSRTIGDGDESKLFHMQTNLRFGCVILRYLLDREQGDLWLGLGRYNGSRGQAPYPRAVLAHQRRWLQAVD